MFSIPPLKAVYATNQWCMLKFQDITTSRVNLLQLGYVLEILRCMFGYDGSGSLKNARGV